MSERSLRADILGSLRNEKAPRGGALNLAERVGLCQSRLTPILPSLRDRALRVQANAPGIRLVEPKRLLIKRSPTNKKNGRRARLFYLAERDSVTFRDPGAAAFGIADTFRIPPRAKQLARSSP